VILCELCVLFCPVSCFASNSYNNIPKLIIKRVSTARDGRDTADTMERFAAATALNQKYDIDHAQLIGRGKLSVVHRARR
jgi:Fe-S-cluster-containing hydrogenase component 2